jgi:hypothetical protein
MNHSQFTWKTYTSFHVPRGCRPGIIVVKYVSDIDALALGGRRRAVNDESEQTFDVLKAALRANRPAFLRCDANI